MSSGRKRNRSASPPAAAAAGSSRRVLSPVQTGGLGRNSPPPSPTPSPPGDAEDSDTLLARRARRRAAHAGWELRPISPDPTHTPEQRWINARRTEAIERLDALRANNQFPERATGLRDPVLRITENRTFTYAQQRDALERLALDQHIAQQERSALIKAKQKKKKDKLEKRKQAKRQCGPPKSHKRQGSPPDSPPRRPTPGAEFSTVGLALRIKA